MYNTRVKIERHNQNVYKKQIHGEIISLIFSENFDQ